MEGRIRAALRAAEKLGAELNEIVMVAEQVTPEGRAFWHALSELLGQNGHVINRLMDLLGD